MSLNKNKKILQVSCCSLARAGIQSVIMEIVRNLYNDYDFDILLFTNRTEYYDEEFIKYGRIFRLNCYDYTNTFGKYFNYLKRPFLQFFGTYSLIKKERYDIVHYHYGLDGFPVLLAALFANVKTIIIHSHNTKSPERRSLISLLYRFLAKQIIHRITALRVGCSEEANQYMFGNDKAIVINNPIDFSYFDYWMYPHIDSNTIRITNIGRYSYQKNQEFVLDVFNEIHKRNNNSLLNLVGFGDDVAELKNKTFQMGLNDFVKFYPSDSNIPALLSETDLFLFPSRYEGLGMVLVEAQAMGVYCFASDCVPSCTNVGKCEYLSLNMSPKEWSDRMLLTYSDVEKMKSLPDFEKLSEYDFKKIKNSYIEIYSR